jgi:molybdopterin converting factor small subunit
MKVKVYISPFFNVSAMDEDGYINIKEDASVNTLYKVLKIPLPLRPFVKCYVNHKPARLRQKLKDNDTVSMIGIIAGG